MVASAIATTTIPTFPTGVLSPDAFMYYNYTSFYVIEDGSMITYAVEYSYGKSPDTSGSSYAYYVSSSGSVSSFGIDFGITSSYGRIQSPNTGYVTDAWYVKSDGDVYHSVGGVNHNSYGFAEHGLGRSCLWCQSFR